ncbi:CKS1 protein, partial [Polyodon spathula]|nr:CKS1 protein [Polyodon spathula]
MHASVARCKVQGAEALTPGALTAPAASLSTQGRGFEKRSWSALLQSERRSGRLKFKSCFTKACQKMSKKQIYYSDKYTDEEFEYRHVLLPKQLARLVPTSHLMSEDEWRSLGVQQSQGWVHYMIHKPGVQQETLTLTEIKLGPLL